MESGNMTNLRFIGSARREVGLKLPLWRRLLQPLEAGRVSMLYGELRGIVGTGGSARRPDLEVMSSMKCFLEGEVKFEDLMETCKTNQFGLGSVLNSRSKRMDRILGEFTAQLTQTKREMFEQMLNAARQEIAGNRSVR